MINRFWWQRLFLLLSRASLAKAHVGQQAVNNPTWPALTQPIPLLAPPVLSAQAGAARAAAAKRLGGCQCTLITTIRRIAIGAKQQRDVVMRN